MNNTKKRTARAGLLAGSLVLACGATAFPASAAPTPKTQIKTTALSNTQDACSVHKSLGYACTTFIYSVNGAGQAVVRPSVCFHQNQTTRRTVVTLLSYGARGSGANKTIVPTSAIAEPGGFWRLTTCIDIFTSWAFRSPGAWMNTEVSDGSTVQTFTTYSPA
jgi:hypothetical protein